MFPLLPTLRRIATSPGPQTHEVECRDQTEARHRWFTKPDVTGDLEHPMASGVRNDLDSDLVPIEEVD